MDDGRKKWFFGICFLIVFTIIISFFLGTRLFWLLEENKNPFDLQKVLPREDEVVPRPPSIDPEIWKNLNRKEKEVIYVFSRQVMFETNNRLAFYLRKMELEVKPDDLPVVTHIGFSVFRPRGEELLFIVWFQAFEKGNAGRAKLRPAYIGQWQACPSLDSEAFRKGVASSSKVIAEEVAVLTSTVVQK